VEHLKRWSREEDREQYKQVALTRPGTLCPPPTPHALRDEYTRTIAPARALAAEALALERTLSELANQAYGLTPAEIALMWKTAPPRMTIPAPAI
jgi:aryl-alcohol dehydrogenase-like predicted oxidoreductase